MERSGWGRYGVYDDMAHGIEGEGCGDSFFCFRGFARLRFLYTPFLLACGYTTRLRI